MPKARLSMLMDLLEGRPSEIDAINSAIPPEVEKYGIPTPFNTVVTSLVRSKEKRHKKTEFSGFWKPLSMFW